MKLFLSWSGERSRHVASALREWLPLVLESVEPWMSERDIQAGQRWTHELSDQLSSTDFGIICLTQKNLAAPWILFETGALAKAVDEAHVVPYLIDLQPSDIPPGPLSQFQAKMASREHTFSVLTAINRGLGEEGREPAIICKVFDKWWPELEKKLNELPPSPDTETARPERDMIEEILVLVRDLAHGSERQLAGRPKSEYEKLLEKLDLQLYEPRSDSLKRYLRDVMDRATQIAEQDETDT